MTSLSELMSALHAMEKVMDEMPIITEEIIAEHDEQIKEIDKKVDFYDKFMQSCKTFAAEASERAEAWTNKAKHYESALKNAERRMLYLIKTNPDIEYRGTEVKFRVKLNPVALNCHFIANKSFSNVIPEDLIMAVPEKYREARLVWQMRSSEVKKALGSPTSDVNFATLRQSEKLVTEFKVKSDK